MFHLDTGVHFNEIEFLIGGQNKFNGTGILVAGGLGGPHGGVAHALAQIRRQGMGRRLLQELLILSLDGAVPLAQLDDIAVFVGQNLKFDVAGVENQLFDVHFIAAEAGHGLGHGLPEQVPHFRRLIDTAHAAAAAAGGGFDEHRVPDALTDFDGLVLIADQTVGAGHHRHAHGLHQRPCCGFIAHLADNIAAGTDKGDTGVPAGVGKGIVFRQETVAGVDGVAACGLGHRQDGIHIEVAVTGPGGTNADGLLGKEHMEGIGVGGGVDSDGLDAHFPAGPQNPRGDFAAVGNEDFLKHGCTGGWGRRRPPERRCPPESPPPGDHRGREFHSWFSWLR